MQPIFSGKFFRDFEHREYFYALLLNRSNRVLGYYQVSVGGISGTVVDIQPYSSGSN
jgi:DNA repair protein RadC